MAGLLVTIASAHAQAEAAFDPIPVQPVQEEAEAEEDIEVIRVVGFDTHGPPPETTAFGEEIDLTRYAGEQRRLEDILAESVGVQIRRFGGAGERAEVSIRGFSAAQVRVELDGVELNGGRSQGVDLASLPLAQLEAVEVLRGGNAIAGGNGAMGGVLRLRTRRPDFPSGDVRVQAGSFGTVETALHATRPGERFDLGFGYSGFRTQGDYEFARITRVFEDGPELPPSTPSAERINNDRQRHDGHLSLGMDLGERGYLLGQALIGYQAGGEPGLDRENASAIAGQQADAEQDRLRALGQLRLEATPIPGPMGELEATLAHRYEGSEFRDDDPALEDRPIDDAFEDHSTTLALSPRWERTDRFADHDLRGRFELRRDAFDATDARARERYGLALAVQDAVAFPGFPGGTLRIVPGVRFEWNEDSGSHFLPGAGLVYEPRPWLRLRGNASRSFRNPTFQDLYLPDRGITSGNPDLDPERADHFDLGIELRFGRVAFLQGVEIAASVFRSEIENSIVWLRVSPYKIRPENTDDARVEGVELALSFDIASALHVHANHTELRAEVEPDGVRLPGRAERETSVRLEWRSHEAWKLNGEFQHTGSITVSDGGAYVLPSREVFNASAAVDLAAVLRALHLDPELQHIWLNAAVDNIGDVAVRDSQSFPQPGRTLRVGMEATW